MDNGNYTLTLRNAKIAHNSNVVLNDINLELAKGEFVYLVGKTGSGKSSLLKTLYGELPLSSGEGTVAGFDLRKLKRKEIPFLRRKLGIIFQDFQLLSDRSVNDNLKFVLGATGWKSKTDITHRVDQVLQKVGLETKGYKMPHQLSGGEQQRVAIARALLNDPELLLADEPTGNLDPETSDNILALLAEISKNGRSVVMATHDFGIIERFPSRIVRCEQGQLHEETAD